MARYEVIMPQMGESIAEGTVVQWLKAPGDAVERDENLLEITTDKVDAEIPSPATGTLAEILVEPGTTVEVGTVIAVIQTEGGAATQPSSSPPASTPQAAPAPASSTVEVIMPQMGESIAEGTVVQWLKAPGDAVERDENLLEITTDKVDAEIPSPATGTLAEILVEPGTTVEVGTVIARLSVAGGAPRASVSTASAPAPSSSSAPAPSRPTASRSADGFQMLPAGADDDAATLRRRRSTPLVRKIAAEHNIDITRLTGSGLSGRVTKKDILAYIEAQKNAPSRPAPRRALSAAPAAHVEGPTILVRDRDRIEDMSSMRASIADHMVMSRRTSPHAHTVHEFDFSRVIAVRKKLAPQFAERGLKLTYTAFIAKACLEGLRRYPIMNSAVMGRQVVYRGDINLGVAVALEEGLIVPVVRNADELNLLGLSRAIGDVAERARTRRLKPEEVTGGTFTLTNPGIFGSLFGIPIINQPQVAILGCGAVKKRVIVQEDDSIAVKPIGVFCLSFDHRVVDGAIADHFMNVIKDTLNTFPDTL